MARPGDRVAHPDERFPLRALAYRGRSEFTHTAFVAEQTMEYLRGRQAQASPLPLHRRLLLAAQPLGGAAGVPRSLRPGEPARRGVPRRHVARTGRPRLYRRGTARGDPWVLRHVQRSGPPCGAHSSVPGPVRPGRGHHRALHLGPWGVPWRIPQLRQGLSGPRLHRAGALPHALAAGDRAARPSLPASGGGGGRVPDAARLRGDSRPPAMSRVVRSRWRRRLRPRGIRP